MRYNLYTDGPGFLIIDQERKGNAISIPDLEHLIEINVRIVDYVNTAKADGDSGASEASRELAYISSAKARQLAADDGFTINNSTILYALTAGNINGAKKQGGRWIMPKWAWTEWFEAWKADRLRQASDAG